MLGYLLSSVDVCNYKVSIFTLWLIKRDTAKVVLFNNIYVNSNLLV